MSKMRVVLSILVVLGLVLAALPMAALADDMEPVVATDGPPNQRLPQPITWTPASLSFTLAPGESETKTASFVSQINVAGASLSVSLPLSRYVQVSPQGRFQVTAGATNVVQVRASVPAADVGGARTVVGTVTVVSPGRHYQLPLVVTLTKQAERRPIAWTPPAVELHLYVPPTTDSAQQLPHTATVTFTSQITIENARLRADAPLNSVLDIEPAGPVSVLPGVPYPVVLTAHLPIATTDAADVELSGDWVFKGQVVVYDAARAYARPLPVTVHIHRAPSQPVIAWRPPVVTLLLPPGQGATQGVTMTTRITLENPRLLVTGPITPFVSISFVGADPAQLVPATPYAMSVTVAPLPATVVRPLAGEVYVVGGNGQIYRHGLKVMIVPRVGTPTGP